MCDRADARLLVVRDVRAVQGGVGLRIVYVGLAEIACPVVGVDGGLSICYVGDAEQPPYRIVSVGIGGFESIASTCIIPDFSCPVKGIVHVLHLQAIAVGEGVQLSVALVVGIGGKGLRSHADRGAVSKVVVGEMIGGGIRGDACKALGDGIVGIADLGAVFYRSGSRIVVFVLVLVLVLVVVAVILFII